MPRRVLTLPGLEFPVTRESPAQGLFVYQPARGYRYAMEPFLLAGWAIERARPGSVLDLGAGCGIVGLLLARLGLGVTAWELRPEWRVLCERSAMESSLSLDYRVGDIRGLPPGDMDLALMNPPYHPLRGYVPGPHALKNAAQSEENGSLDDLVLGAARAARRLCLVVPFERASQAQNACVLAGMQVTSRCEIDRVLVLIEALRSPLAGQDPVIEKVCMRQAGAWSERVRAWYQGLDARLTG